MYSRFFLRKESRMFKACHNAETVRANLDFVRNSKPLTIPTTGLPRQGNVLGKRPCAVLSRKVRFTVGLGDANNSGGKKMKWFENKQKKQIAELREEMTKLRDEISKLRSKDEIRVGAFPQHAGLVWYPGYDPRPAVSVREVVMLLVERMGLELTQTQKCDAKTTLERKPKKSPNALNNLRRPLN